MTTVVCEGHGEKIVLTSITGNDNWKYRDFGFTAEFDTEEQADYFIDLMTDLFGAASDGGINFKKETN